MKAVKTKSGKWRCRPVDHYEGTGKNRRAVLASITRNTKQEALRDAYAYEQSRKLRGKAPLTFSAALSKYIASRRHIISQTTLRGYETLQRHAYGLIDDLALSDFTSAIVQAWADNYAGSHSPKSTANAYGLIAAVLSMFRPEQRFSVTLPQRTPPALYTPTDDDLKHLLDYIKGTDLEPAVLLSAFGTLRRGEACALTYDDIQGDAITINKSLVKDASGKWLLKAPKTPESVRTVILPHEVIERLLRDRGSSERIITLSPSQVSDRFRTAVRKCGLPPFRFHDLRAYAASIRHALGIPDQYIMADGGWSSDAVLKQIYRRTMADKSEQFTQKVNAHFSSLLNGNKKGNFFSEISDDSDGISNA